MNFQCKTEDAGYVAKQGCVGSDIIYAERRGQSQKPEEIYQLIEELVPGGNLSFSRGRMLFMLYGHLISFAEGLDCFYAHMPTVTRASCCLCRSMLPVTNMTKRGRYSFYSEPESHNEFDAMPDIQQENTWRSLGVRTTCTTTG
jgi:hypothetical protein